MICREWEALKLYTPVFKSTSPTEEGSILIFSGDFILLLSQKIIRRLEWECPNKNE